MSDNTDTKEIQKSENEESISEAQDRSCCCVVDPCGCYVDPCCCTPSYDCCC